ncbi:hypothetical protein BGZ82_005561, partial [Podila clonocystis]
MDYTAQQLLMLDMDNDPNIQKLQRSLCNNLCKNGRPFCETHPSVDCEEEAK